MADVAAPTRVVIADDDVLIREGIASLLERSRFDVVGQSDNATELLALVNDRRPDLATDVVDFVATLERIAKGASVVDPALVQELVAARPRPRPAR